MPNFASTFLIKKANKDAMEINFKRDFCAAYSFFSVTRNRKDIHWQFQDICA